MRSRSGAGMTLVEILIAMAILGIVLMLTSSGIVQSLQVNRLVDDSTNTQAKLRRITEVVSQELRSAVMGGLTDFPVTPSSSSISFALISGDGGLPVTTNPNSRRTGVFTSDPGTLSELVGSPALIIDGHGRAILISEIEGVSGSELVHNQCPIDFDHPVNTRVYGASALGFSYNADEETLYQLTLDAQGLNSVPFAFGLTRFQIAYEYGAGAGNTRVLEQPRFVGDVPQIEFTEDGTIYRLSRLRLTLASVAEGSDLEREYVSYVEMTGIGNDFERQRTISEFVPCGTGVPEDPGGPGPGGPGGEDPGPGGPGDPGDDPDPGDGGGDDGGGDDGGGNPGGGDSGCTKSWGFCR